MFWLLLLKEGSSELSLSLCLVLYLYLWNLYHDKNQARNEWLLLLWIRESLIYTFYYNYCTSFNLYSIERSSVDIYTSHSQSTLFSNFLLRANKYCALQLGTTFAIDTPAQNRIILVEVRNLYSLHFIYYVIMDAWMSLHIHAVFLFLLLNLKHNQ